MTIGEGGHVDYKGGFLLPTDKSLGDTSDIISDSSGVGTSNSDTTTQGSVSVPGMTVVCLENYSSGQPGHLRISQGDILEGKLSTFLCYHNKGFFS
jgi:SH3/ankyrin repeat-containing protein